MQTPYAAEEVVGAFTRLGDFLERGEMTLTGEDAGQLSGDLALIQRVCTDLKRCVDGQRMPCVVRIGSYESFTAQAGESGPAAMDFRAEYQAP